MADAELSTADELPRVFPHVVKKQPPKPQKAAAVQETDQTFAKDHVVRAALRHPSSAVTPITILAQVYANVSLLRLRLFRLFGIELGKHEIDGMMQHIRTPMQCRLRVGLKDGISYSFGGTVDLSMSSVEVEEEIDGCFRTFFEEIRLRWEKFTVGSGFSAAVKEVQMAKHSVAATEQIQRQAVEAQGATIRKLKDELADAQSKLEEARQLRGFLQGRYDRLSENSKQQLSSFLSEICILKEQLYRSYRDKGYVGRAVDMVEVIADDSDGVPVMTSLGDLLECRKKVLLHNEKQAMLEQQLSEAQEQLARGYDALDKRNKRVVELEKLAEQNRERIIDIEERLHETKEKLAAAEQIADQEKMKVAYMEGQWDQERRRHEDRLASILGGGSLSPAVDTRDSVAPAHSSDAFPSSERSCEGEEDHSSAADAVVADFDLRIKAKEDDIVVKLEVAAADEAGDETAEGDATPAGELFPPQPRRVLSEGGGSMSTEAMTGTTARKQSVAVSRRASRAASQKDEEAQHSRPSSRAPSVTILEGQDTPTRQPSQAASRRQSAQDLPRKTTPNQLTPHRQSFRSTKKDSSRSMKTTMVHAETQTQTGGAIRKAEDILRSTATTPKSEGPALFPPLSLPTLPPPGSMPTRSPSTHPPSIPPQLPLPAFPVLPQGQTSPISWGSLLTKTPPSQAASPSSNPSAPSGTPAGQGGPSSGADLPSIPPLPSRGHSPQLPQTPVGTSAGGPAGGPATLAGGSGGHAISAGGHATVPAAPSRGAAVASDSTATTSPAGAEGTLVSDGEAVQPEAPEQQTVQMHTYQVQPPEGAQGAPEGQPAGEEQQPILDLSEVAAYWEQMARVLHDQLAQREELVRSLAEAVNENAAELHQKCQEIDELQMFVSKAEVLQDKLADARSIITELEDEVCTMDTRITELENANMEMVQRHVTVTADLSNKLAESVTQVGVLRKKNEVLENAFIHHKKKLRALKVREGLEEYKRMVQLRERDRFEKEITAVRDDFEANLQQQIAEVREAESRFCRKQQQHRMVVEDLLSLSVQRKNELETSRKEHDDLVRAHNNLLNDYTILRGEYESVTEKLRQIKSEKLEMSRDGTIPELQDTAALDSKLKEIAPPDPSRQRFFFEGNTAVVPASPTSPTKAHPAFNLLQSQLRLPSLPPEVGLSNSRAQVVYGTFLLHKELLAFYKFLHDRLTQTKTLESSYSAIYDEPPSFLATSGQANDILSIDRMLKERRDNELRMKQHLQQVSLMSWKKMSVFGEIESHLLSLQFYIKHVVSAVSTSTLHTSKLLADELPLLTKTWPALQSPRFRDLAHKEEVVKSAPCPEILSVSQLEKQSYRRRSVHGEVTEQEMRSIAKRADEMAEADASGVTPKAKGIPALQITGDGATPLLGWMGSSGLVDPADRTGRPNTQGAPVSESCERGGAEADDKLPSICILTRVDRQLQEIEDIDEPYEPIDDDGGDVSLYEKGGVNLALPQHSFVNRRPTHPNAPPKEYLTKLPSTAPKWSSAATMTPPRSSSSIGRSRGGSTQRSGSELDPVLPPGRRVPRVLEARRARRSNRNSRTV